MNSKGDLMKENDTISITLQEFYQRTAENLHRNKVPLSDAVTGIIIQYEAIEDYYKGFGKSKKEEKSNEDKFKCPIDYEECESNCGNYSCGN